MDLRQWLINQIAWSRKTFGPGQRVEGICKHIEKELKEIRKAPNDESERIDVAILAFDSAWRSIGYGPGGEHLSDKIIADTVVRALMSKSVENMFVRKWPEPGPEDKPSEHIRDIDGVNRPVE